MYQSTNFSLLLGEDDPCDVRVMEHVLSDIGYDGGFAQQSLGQDVIDYTLKRNQFNQASHATPDLIILDIGLPGVSGLEALAALREDERSAHIPVLMCSGSASQRDYHQCIALGCNAYLQKSPDIEAFTRTCALFIEGWWRLSQQEYF